MSIQTIRLGASELEIAPLGLGACSWGDQLFWGYGNAYSLPEIAEAFRVSLGAGVTFVDTAEFYGSGESERILGKLARTIQQPVVIATKFMPYPWRFSARSLRRALKKSLKRLGVQRVDLYQIHFPSSIIGIPQLMDVLADAVADGEARYVGVSNYSATEMRVAHAALAKRGVPLVSNQVQYSLLHRAPESDGVLAACRELNVTLIAYSPLEMGLLTGKYGPGTPPGGLRRFYSRFSAANLRAVEPVIGLLRTIGAAHGGKTPSQVALNWLIQHGTLPIPGAKNARQASDNAAALGWSLTSAEVAALDAATSVWL